MQKTTTDETVSVMVMLRIKPKTAEKLDKKRGDIPRSTYIRKLCEKEIGV
jgi:hypothetical protein